jgi:hypothetical protein
MSTTIDRAPARTPRDAPAADTRQIVRKVLLACGVLSSALYIVAADVVAASLFDGYSRISQNISELFAFGAPSRTAFLALGLVYSVLVIAFGIGVLASAGGKRALRVAGWMVIVYGSLGFTGPFFSMSQRSAIEGPMAFNDLMHIILTAALVLSLIAVIVLAATAFGTRFRLYSIATLVAMVVGGALTAMQAPQLAAGEPTPWMGLTERLGIGPSLLWLAVLAVALWRRQGTGPDSTVQPTRGGVQPGLARGGEQGEPF